MAEGHLDSKIKEIDHTQKPLVVLLKGILSPAPASKQQLYQRRQVTTRGCGRAWE